MRASFPRALPLTALVLAGGRSRRMGRDKARLKVHGARVIDLLLEDLRPRFGSILVASGSRPIPGLEVRQVADPGTQGPLAGLAAGLAASRTPWILAVTCDQLPAPDALLRRLWENRRGAKVVTLAHPFPGLYARTLLPVIRRLLAAGKGPSDLPARRLGGPVPKSWNTPAEFRRLKGSLHLSATRAHQRAGF